MKLFKKLVIAGMVILALPIVVLASNPVNIKTAANNKLVNITVKSKGTHTGKCVLFKLKNNSSKTIKLAIDAGRRLICNDPSRQDLIITENATITILPNQTVTQNIYAMCAEASDKTPTTENSFSVGNANNAHLVSLANIIYNNNLQNSTGQSAVWCITDNKPLTDIVSNDTLTANVLRRFVASAKGITYMPLLLESKAPEFKMQLYVGFNLSSKKLITIRVKDRNDKIVKIYYQDYPFSNGAHNTKVEFTKFNEEKEHYILEIMANDEIITRRSFVF